MTLDDILEFVKNKFELEVESIVTANVLLLKIQGVDNYSLAEYIYDNLDGVTVSVCSHEKYRYSNLGWIKVEISDNKQLLDTKTKHETR
jgi:hypothetical protein